MELTYYRAGSGEPLVLIHGIGGRWQWWQPVLSRLEAQREVIAIDLPGFGASPMPPASTPAGTASLAGLVAEFFDSLGLERPHVAGNSLGGGVSLELARRNRVRSATVLSPVGFHNDLERRFQFASLWSIRRATRLLAPSAEALVRSKAMRSLTGFQYYAHPERLDPAALAGDIRAAAYAPWYDDTLRAITTPEVFSGGDQIRVPVTIAWGEHDRLLLPRQAERAQAAIPSARVITLGGCGHIPMPDDPEQVASVLLEGSAPPGAQNR